MKQRILKSTPARLKVMRERHTANALDATLSTHRRVASIQFLGQMPGEKSDALLPLMVQPQALDLQLAAARALVQSLAELPAAVLQEWHAFRPELREILLDFVVSKPSLHLSLLEAVDRGDIPKWHINANRKRILLQSANPVVSQRAVNLLGSSAAGDRQKAFEEHKLVLAMKGSSAKGQTVFLNLCASCHQHRNDGYKVGPDLTSVRNQPAEALLYHIIVPDAEVYPGFQNYEVETSDGEHYNGLLAGETDTAVTLVQALGEKQQIDRSQIARFRGSAFSLMPNELEKAMSHQELADLLAFLKAP
jgi:putative heme-binding domain-containing protein